MHACNIWIVSVCSCWRCMYVCKYMCVCLCVYACVFVYMHVFLRTCSMSLSVSVSVPLWICKCIYYIYRKRVVYCIRNKIVYNHLMHARIFFLLSLSSTHNFPQPLSFSPSIHTLSSLVMEVNPKGFTSITNVPGAEMGRPISFMRRAET